jgi:hypothetical protein
VLACQSDRTSALGERRESPGRARGAPVLAHTETLANTCS